MNEIVTFLRVLDSFFEFSAIDCQWDEWNVGQCSKTCGGGTRKNTRNKIVYEKNGGTCSDSSPSQMKAEDCNPQPCPGGE